MASAASAQDIPRLQLDVLNIAVEAPAFIPESCGLDFSSQPSIDTAVCVAFPIQSDANGVSWDSHFVRLLAERGWEFVGGAANVYYLERPMDDDDCSQRMNMIGWLLGDEEEIAKYGTMEEDSIDWSKIPFRTFIFAIERAPVCGSSRYAQ
ncbi:MAG: hypothetical protein GC206_06310 [Alphaproteobacteria bacterium]|nr:hypothetical protein [Alphaproteobacteria bacterium]